MTFPSGQVIAGYVVKDGNEDWELIGSRSPQDAQVHVQPINLFPVSTSSWCLLAMEAGNEATRIISMVSSLSLLLLNFTPGFLSCYELCHCEPW